MNVPLWPRPLFKREKNELDMRFGKSQNTLWGVFFIFSRERHKLLEQYQTVCKRASNSQTEQNLRVIILRYLWD